MHSKSFHIKIESNVIHLNNIDSFMGKEVIVSIIELPQKQSGKKKKWNYLGSGNSGKSIDESNIRDLAYE